MEGLRSVFLGNAVFAVTVPGILASHAVIPDLVRPALEAFGFDIGKTVRELFGYELQWDNGGDSPWRLTLVGALFHDRMPGEISFM